MFIFYLVIVVLFGFFGEIACILLKCNWLSPRMLYIANLLYLKASFPKIWADMISSISYSSHMRMKKSFGVQLLASNPSIHFSWA